MALEYVTTDRGRQKLILDNYLYAHDRLCVDGREMWRCDRRNECKARVHTMHGYIIQRINEHTHPPDSEKIQQIRASDWVIHQNRPSDEEVEVSGAEGENPTSLMLNTSSGTNRRRRRHANSFPVFPPFLRESEGGSPAKMPSMSQLPSSACSSTTSSSTLFLSPITSEISTDPDQVKKEEIEKNLSRSVLIGGAEINAVDSDDQLIFKDPKTFWSSVYDLGVFEDLYAEVQAQMDLMRRAFASRPDVRAEIAAKLSDIVRLLECGGKVNNALHAKRMLTQAETHLLSNEIEELQRKTEERRRKQEEIQRKAEMFSQLFGAPKAEPNTPQLSNIFDDLLQAARNASLSPTETPSSSVDSI